MKRYFKIEKIYSLELLKSKFEQLKDFETYIKSFDNTEGELKIVDLKLKGINNNLILKLDYYIVSNEIDPDANNESILLCNNDFISFLDF